MKVRSLFGLSRVKGRKRRSRSVQWDYLEERRLLSNFSVDWKGQQNYDLVGPDGAAGPDGIVDIKLHLSNLQPYPVTDVMVSVGSAATTPADWAFGKNPDEVPRAELIREGSYPDPNNPYDFDDSLTMADLYFNPPPSGTSLSSLTITVEYSQVIQNYTIPNDVYTLTTPGGYTYNPTEAYIYPTTSTVIPTPGGTAEFVEQYQTAKVTDDASGNAHKAGDVHIYLDSLPSPYTFDNIVGATLSDDLVWTHDFYQNQDPASPLGLYNYPQATSSTAPSLILKPPAAQDNPSHARIADLYYPPARDEEGQIMTLLITVEDASPAHVKHSFYMQFTSETTNVDWRDATYDSSSPVINVSPAGTDYVSFHDPADTANPISTTTDTLEHLVGMAVTSHLYDHINLTAGNYIIDSSSTAYPLVFNRPLQLTASAGATITFTVNSFTGTGNPTIAFQPSFQIVSSHVHLEGFAVRYQNPVYFRYYGYQPVQYPDDQIGAFFSPGSEQLVNVGAPPQIVDLVLSNLDIQGPAQALSPEWKTGTTIPAPGLPPQDIIHFDEASGSITGNLLRGGSTTINGGPWNVTSNHYVGVVPTDLLFPSDYPNLSLRDTRIPTYAQSVFNSSRAHDQWYDGNTATVTPLVVDNVVMPLGENYRLLYFNGDGYNIRATNNQILAGMGRRYGTDSFQDPSYGIPVDPNNSIFQNPDNAPEMILSENYHIYFEGYAKLSSTDGHILTIPSTQNSIHGWAITPGSIVSILNGSDAGNWYTITQVLSQTEFLLDSAMPTGPYAISITAGQVHTVYDSNIIHMEGTTSVGIDITANFFDVQVTHNKFFGSDTNNYLIDGGGNLQGAMAIQIVAKPGDTFSSNKNQGLPYPFFTPFWFSVGPILGLDVEDNTVNNVIGGIRLFADELTHPSIGRRYITGTISNNTFAGYKATPTPDQSGVAPPDVARPDESTLLSIGTYKLSAPWGDHHEDDLRWDIGYANLDGSNLPLKTGGSYKPAADLPWPANPTSYYYHFADPYAISLTMTNNVLSIPQGQTVFDKYIQYASAYINTVPMVYGATGARVALTPSTPSPPNPPIPYSYDFGPSNQTVAAGYTGVSNASSPTYTLAAGYGWTAIAMTGMSAVDRGAGSGTDLTRDAVYATDMTFQVDLPNGFYDVTPTLGDVGTNATSGINLYVQGTRVALASTTAGHTVSPTYLAKVSGGHLVLQFYQGTSDVYLDSLVIAPRNYPLKFDFGIPPATPDGGDGVSNFTLYSADLGYGITANPTNDMNVATGPPSYLYANDMTFQVDVPDGSYLVTPVLIAGNSSDTVTVKLQGSTAATLGVGTGPVTATYVATVTDGHLTIELIGGGSNQLARLSTLTVVPLSFDFGPSNQTVADGFTPVSNFSQYTQTVGYGWSTFSPDMNTDDRGAASGTALTRDAVYSTDMTFQVDLPDGFYDVTPTLGDVAPGTTSGINLYVQGTRVALASTTAGQTVSPTYLAKVTDGHLSLRFYQPTPANGTIYLDSLVIAPRNYPLKFDFGIPPATPDGGDVVSNFTGYTTNLGYGITASSGNMNVATGPPSYLYATNMTFRVDVPDGGYIITPTLVGTGNLSDTVAVKLQGSTVATLTTTTGPITGSYVATVNDGYLTIELIGGGTAQQARISGLTITPTIFLGTNTTTKGNWKGVYGTDGSYIVGDVADYPSYATVTLNDVQALPHTWASSTTYTSALQKSVYNSSTDRIASTLLSSDPNTSTFTVDIDFTDGKSHQLAAYFLDWTNSGRDENVDVLDADTGAVLDTHNVSGTNFVNGEYLVWDLSGHVTLRISNHNGPNVVLSGLFFDSPGSTTSATYVGTNTTTRGSWIGVYGVHGVHGSYIVGDAADYPYYATVTLNDVTQPHTWASSTTDTRALQHADGSGRIASTLLSNDPSGTFTVDVDFTDGKTHQLAAYFLDWTNSGRDENVDVLDADTGAVLDTHNVSGPDFTHGEYLVWDLSGHVTLRISNHYGPNVVLSGLFFDPES